MRILVTGATGQVGSAIAARFQQFGTIVAADRNTIDLEKPEQISKRLSDIAPDLIVNAAAYTGVDLAEDEKERAFLVNGASPGAIAQWAATRSMPLIHFSTDYVFDGSGDRPWREDDPTGPLNVYGASKLAGEQAIQSAGGSSLIVRTSWVYSATGKDFLRTMSKLMREREELSVVDDQHGAPTSAAYIADTLAGIVRHHLADLPSAFETAANKVHLAAGGTATWHEFAEAILKGLTTRGAKLATRRILAIPSKDFPAKARRPLNSRLDLSRLEKFFGVRPTPWKVLLESELDRLVEAF